MSILNKKSLPSRHLRCASITESIPQNEFFRNNYNMSESKQASNDVAGRAKVFHLFPTLAKELQLMIWEAAVVPRVIEIILRPARSKSGDRNLVAQSRTENPGILGANQDSRYIALKHMEDAFTLNQCPGQTIYFNFKTDTLLMEEQEDLVWFSGKHDFFSQEGHDSLIEACKGIRYIAIGGIAISGTTRAHLAACHDLEIVYFEQPIINPHKSYFEYINDAGETTKQREYTARWMFENCFREVHQTVECHHPGGKPTTPRVIFLNGADWDELFYSDEE